MVILILLKVLVPRGLHHNPPKENPNDYVKLFSVLHHQMVCVLPFRLLNNMADFHEIWYGHYAIKGLSVTYFLIYYNQ